jgi:hypothetical protein
VDENNCSTATSDNAATVSLLNVSFVDPPLGVSVINPADRKACTWWVIVGFETLRLRDSSAEVVGVRASIDAIAYRVVSPRARNTDSAFIARPFFGREPRELRCSSRILLGASGSVVIGRYRVTRCAPVSYFAHHRRPLNADGIT